MNLEAKGNGGQWPDLEARPGLSFFRSPSEPPFVTDAKKTSERCVALHRRRRRRLCRRELAETLPIGVTVLAILLNKGTRVFPDQGVPGWNEVNKTNNKQKPGLRCWMLSSPPPGFCLIE